MRPIWFSQSRRSRSISAAVFFFRPNIKYAATTAASPASRRVYKRNGIFDKAPGVLSTKNMTRNAFREETRELRKSRAVSHQLSAVSRQQKLTIRLRETRESIHVEVHFLMADS